MGRFATLLANGLVLLIWNDRSVRVPEICVAGASAIRFRDSTPEFAAGRGTSITNRIGNDLARRSTNCQRDPVLLDLFHDK